MFYWQFNRAGSAGVIDDGHLGFYSPYTSALWTPGRDTCQAAALPARRKTRIVASRDPTVDRCVSLALDWLNKLHVSRVENSTKEQVTASQVADDEFRKRIEQSDKRLRGSAVDRPTDDSRQTTKS